MDLHVIDYISVSGQSWLHRCPAYAKIVTLLAIIALLLTVTWLVADAAIFLLMLLFALTARIPFRLYIALTLYPILFLLLIFLSSGELTWIAMLFLVLRVLAITATVVLFLLTTSYPAIFGTLSAILPSFLLAALFFTYRSIFVISDSLVNIWIALHLRGGISWRTPGKSLHNLGMALGHALIHAIDTSQRMADSLTVRGFQNRLYYLVAPHARR